MRVISFDPSGNWGKEGMGTTGIAILEDGEPKELLEIKASDFDSEVEYWNQHVYMINYLGANYVCCEGYKLYNHKGKAASMQANSELQTSQLIGVIKYHCFDRNIPLTIQFASEVKTRWSDKVLQNLGYLDEKNRFNGQATNPHKKDALRHALHFVRYGVKKYEGC
jgi:hypothetical protein